MQISVERIPRRRTLVAAAVALLVVGTFVYWLYARRFEKTDDAQVDGDITNLSPRVAGTVKAVFVADNQAVEPGQVIAEIDPADYEVAVAQAKASLDEASAQLEAEDPNVPITETANRTSLERSNADLASARISVTEAKKLLAQAKAQLSVAQANNRNAQVERRRAAALIADHAITQSQFDARSDAARASQANVAALHGLVSAFRARVGEAQQQVPINTARLEEVRKNSPLQVRARRATVKWREASMEVARARLAQAILNLRYAKILAPVRGIVGKKSLNIGDHIAPGQQVLAISQTDDLWITANFRETQLRHMTPGQRADIHIDALGSTLHGTVESIGGATGSRYSVLPPENATGNYVKVVQRIPVRIRLDPRQSGIDRLRPGMSVDAKVRIR
jgi:membrane fusion protein (multidrug efflux system)